MPQLSIVIISWNTRELLRACLVSVFAEPNLALEVIVVDNASCDGTPTMLRNLFPQICVIENGENLGFAKANNLALPHCSAPYILLLNSDTIVRGHALSVMLTFLESHLNVAAVGPKLLHPRLQLDVLGCGGQPTLRRTFNHYFFLARLFPNIRSLEGLYCYLGVHDRAPRSVGWISGACLMVRRELIKTIGGLNDRWFMYGEDVEWCARMLASGMEIYHVPAAVVEHHSGASTEQHTEGYSLPIRASRDVFIQMNHPSFIELFLHDAIRVIGFSLRSIAYFARSLVANPEQKPMWRSRSRTFAAYSRVAAGYPHKSEH